MIVEALLNIIYRVLSAIISVFHIGSISDNDLNSVYQVLSSLFDSSASLIDLFLPWRLCLVLLTITIIIINFDSIYRFVMWILRKIPFLGIQ